MKTVWPLGAMRRALWHLSLSCLIAAATALSTVAGGDGNRFAYLDRNDPYYPGRDVAALRTPQWVGEPGVEAVVVLAIDDMRGHEKWEAYLRPILERLKQIDGRAALSIMTCQIAPDDPHLQKWLAEGVSLECHTSDHPCPLLKDGSLAQAKSTYDRCVDLLAATPGNKPVAFRMPCCDSQNTVSPRFYAEIFDGRTDKGNHLQVDSSVFQIFTSRDPSLKRENVLSADGSERLRAYLPFPSFVNTIEDYPYPYVINRTCWEFPCVVPSDWEAQHLLKPANPRMVDDMLAALDCVVEKQGVFDLVFHPYGWIANQQVVQFIDAATKRYGKRVKFLNFREALARINANLLGGEPLRNDQGADNGVRLLDVNNDGSMDVVIGNARQETRIWSPKDGRWLVTEFPTTTIDLSANGAVATRFGAIDGMTVVLGRDAERLKAWCFDGSRWIEAPWRGLPANATAANTRLLDLDADGTCEMLIADAERRDVYRWIADTNQAQPLSGSWNLSEQRLPGDARFVDDHGRDAGLRFHDFDDDFDLDLIYSNEAGYGLYLYEGPDKPWLEVFAETRPQGNRLPPFVLNGTDMGAWFHSRHIWWQNENTAKLSDLVDRRSFNELLEGVAPQPKSPPASLKALAVRAGLQAEIVAAEPLVDDPIAFDWGPDGKLYVVEMGDYPTGVNRRPGGKVRLLEDADGDGRYDRSTVYLEGLKYPTSVISWRNGVFVTAAPDLFYAEDNDGDGLADKREVVVQGFNEGNPQHMANGLTWGLDNWIYGANGDSGGNLKSSLTGAEADISGRDFRYRPTDGAVEDVEGFAQFNRNRDDWGNWFGCSNNNPMWQYVLNDRYLRRNPHLAAPNVKNDVSDHPGAAPVYPRSRLTERFNDPHTANHFTSACGTNIYRDELLGAAFAGNAFICEPVHNLVHREVMISEGIAWTSRRAADEQRSEFMASTDNWFRPVSVRTGPDGALWIADMYRAVIEHPEWIPAAMRQKLDLRAGSDRGRIYRVYPIGKRPRPIENLSQLDAVELAKRLASPNGWVRDKAQQLLVERQDAAAVPTLEALAAEQTGDGEATRATTRLQALCALDGLNAVRKEILLQKLADSHGAVRRHAIRIAERASDDAGVAAALANLVGDSDPQVRLQLAYSLGEFASLDAGRALGELLLGAAGDPWIAPAAFSSALPHLDVVVETIVAKSAGNAEQAGLIAQLLAIAAAAGKQETVVKVIPAISRPIEGRFAPWQLQALADLLDLLDRQNSSLVGFRESANAELRGQIDGLSKVFEAARETARDNKQDDEARQAATVLLGRGLDQQDADLALLESLVSAENSDAVRATVIETLGKLRDERVAQVLLGAWRGFAPAARSQALDIVLARDNLLEAFLAALEQGQLNASEIDTTRRQRLLTHRTAAIRDRAKKVFTAGSEDRRKLIADYLAKTNVTVDPARGEQAFTKHCAVCHRLNERGHAVGPDLTALTDKSPEALTTAILDPNRAIEAKYISYAAVTTNGLSLAGLLTVEAGNSITLMGQENKQQTILRADLEALESTGKSLMPEGFEKDLSPQAVADLIAYLRASEPKPKQLAGNKPEIVRPEPLRQYVFCLPASAEVYGQSLRIEETNGNLGWWSGLDDHAAWTIEIPRDTVYGVFLDIACDDNSAGNSWLLEIGEQRLAGKVESTGDWNTYRRVRVGDVHLKAGQHRLGLRPYAEINGALFDVRSVTLIPLGRLPR